MPLFTCDELTPALCDLRVTNGSLAVRGLEVQYTHYHAVNPDRTKLPIVMVHGGPGWSHHYMLPLKQQACRGRDVYFYDQAGAGTSERPAPSSRIAAPWLFNLSYYPEEMMAVVTHLGLTRHHVLGSSWGTIVAQLYALRRPPGLASLTLSGPLSDSQLYKESQWDADEGNLGSLPPFVQRRLRTLDDAGDYDSVEYKAIAEALTSFFTVRTTPAPDCFARASSLMNPEIYVGIQGASEFTIGGVLENWNITGRLASLGPLPTLLTHGKYDTMRPPVIRAMARAFENAREVELPHSGHCSMIDDAGAMNDAVDTFLTCVEGGECDAPPPAMRTAAAAVAAEAAVRSPLATLVAASLVAGGAGYLAGRARHAAPAPLL